MTDLEDPDSYDRLTWALGISVLVLVTLGVMAVALGTGWLAAKGVDFIIAWMQ